MCAQGPQTYSAYHSVGKPLLGRRQRHENDGGFRTWAVTSTLESPLGFTFNAMHHTSILRRVPLMIVALACLTACNEAGNGNQIELARTLKAKGDAAGAYNVVKDALQKDPNSGQARQLMGLLFLEQVDPASAELEFRKALEANFEPAKTASLLARSMVAQGKFKKVIEEFGPLAADSQKSSDALTIQVATAQAFLGSADTARRLTDSVLRHSPEMAEAQLLDAKLLAAQGNVDASIEKTQKLTSATDPLPDSWLFLGDLLLQGRHDIKGAMAAYDKAAALAPKTLRAHAALITEALRQSDTKRAAAQLEKLRQALPQHPLTKLYEAQIAFTSGRFDRASEICQDILRRVSGSYPVYLLSGASNLKRGELTQAAADLGKAMSLQPEAHMPRQLFAQVYLRMGLPNKAIEVLRPTLDDGEPEPELLSTAAEAYLSLGAYATAESLYQRAGKSRPDDAKISTALALLKLARGQDASAIESLQKIAASDPGTSADLALVSTMMKKKDMDGAMKAIDALAKKTPKSPAPANLRGQILLTKRDVIGARAAFESALKEDPAFFIAAANLSRLDLREGKTDGARKRLEDQVAKRPGSAMPTLALADFRLVAGEKRSAVQPLIDAAVLANPTDAALRVAQIDNHLEANDPKTAVSVAQQASAALPNSPEVTDALGRAQQSNGELNQSLATFGKLIKLLPSSALGRVRSARVHLANKNTDAAINALRQALDVEPGSSDAQKLLLSVSLSLKKPDIAREAAKAIQKRMPNEAIGYVYAGDIEAEGKDFKAAAAAYRAGVGKSRPGKLPNRLHLMLQLSQQAVEADKFAKEWMGAHPNDSAFAFYLGDVAFAKHDYPSAVSAYERVLKIDADHAMAMNNIAYLNTLLKMPGGLAMAERANDLSPDTPPIIDTLAYANAESGHLKEAIELSKRAIQLAPKDPRYVVSLVRYMERNGQAAEARTLMDKVQKAFPFLAKDPEAQAVRAKLGM